MRLQYHKKFLKDLASIPAKERKEIENFVFNEIQMHSNIYDVQRFEKMVGYEGYYKARFGSYRIGVKYLNNVLTFERVLHRKEIYRFFP